MYVTLYDISLPVEHQRPRGMKVPLCSNALKRWDEVNSKSKPEPCPGDWWVETCWLRHCSVNIQELIPMVMFLSALETTATGQRTGKMVHRSLPAQQSAMLLRKRPDICIIVMHTRTHRNIYNYMFVYLSIYLRIYIYYLSIYMIIQLFIYNYLSILRYYLFIHSFIYLFVYIYTQRVVLLWFDIQEFPLPCQFHQGQGGSMIPISREW